MKGPLVTRARFSWIFFLTCDISDRSITTDRSWLFSRIEKIIKARKLSDFFTFNHLIMSHFSRLAIFFQHSNLSLLWRIYPLIFSFYRCYYSQFNFDIIKSFWRFWCHDTICFWGSWDKVDDSQSSNFQGGSKKISQCFVWKIFFWFFSVYL